METEELVKEIRKLTALTIGVPQSAVHCTLDGDMVVVTVTGTLHGSSAKNAMRRRQKALHIAKSAARESGLQLSMTFAVRDAIFSIQELVRTTAAFVLGSTPVSVEVKVGREGRASVIVALANTVEGATDKLRQSITPLLQRAKLSLGDITIVSPIREDVSDARLLRATKILAPCDAVAVARRLKEFDEININPDAVHRRLDSLRRNGLLVYLGDRRFALTAAGLASVPSSRRRESSDIERILALGKRKW